MSDLTIGDLFDIPTRFMRSVQLERDFADPAALDNYIVTPAMAEAFQRVLAGTRPGSGRRAWRITGDYGVGKSAFALVLAHLLSDRPSERARTIGAELGLVAGGDHPPLWPILVTGSREPIVAVVARGIGDALVRRRPAGARARVWTELVDAARALEATPDPAALEVLLERVRELASTSGAGVLLIVDELGKLLEYAAQEPGREDVFILQKLAETASGSGARTFLFAGLLHQGFRAYAERLPSTVRSEWDKVAGRFEEIVFDQPLAHTAALVGGALNVQVDRLPEAVKAAAKKTATATASMGWLGGETSAARTFETAQLYPLHPTLLPPLVRFFSRFGQNERSLFGFLLSSEPFGLQAFAERAASRDAWYGLPEFYDYVRAVFGHRLSGPSSQSHWLQISSTVDGAHDLEPLELRALKAAAVLSLLDADDLMATDAALAACLSPAPPEAVRQVVANLVEHALLFRRGGAGYRLWPNSSVNLQAALIEAEALLGELSSVTAHIGPYLDSDPVLARRHYIETGTMRFFEVRYAAADQLEAAAARPTDADGLILLALGDDALAGEDAVRRATDGALGARDDLVVGVLRPLSVVAGEVRDLRAWRWIADHTPELAHDAYAAAEVRRQIATTRRRLNQALGVEAAFRRRGPTGMPWFYKGRPLDVGAGLTAALSRVCDERFPQAPRVRNELLNRKVLSSAAASARMRLIEGLLTHGDQPLFGIDAGKAPPEKSMYLSVFGAGGLHVSQGEAWAVVEPEVDALNVMPAIREIETLLDRSGGGRVAVRDLLDRLAEPPWGVRAGVSPLLLAVVLKMRGHEIALYENGTFLAAFGGPDIMRLIKRPELFELQLCRVEGVRADVFARLAEAFAQSPGQRSAELLDVVAPLSRFVARLPDYTRKAGALTPRAVKVRDALLSAREPGGLLFRDLPVACDLEPFTTDASADAGLAAQFVERLQEAIAELRADYPRLLQRIIATVAETVTPDARQFDRVALAARASRVALAATAPRLKTFALRLRDPGISDEAWAEALASFLIAKPTARWGVGDEARCLEELAGLSDLFHRVEAVAFRSGETRPDVEAVGVTLTRGDGLDRFLVVESADVSEASAEQLVEFWKHLPDDHALKIQYLTRLLWKAIGDEGTRGRTAPSRPVERSQTS
ncbi:hypothetical protein [Brevundimonas sp. FT23042]|uniref:hypothetical protein n=1 Tax=Brevundimonas sp. FT23042 TaxID=3393749 RepID=UPI003B58845C